MLREIGAISLSFEHKHLASEKTYCLVFSYLTNNWALFTTRPVVIGLLHFKNSLFVYHRLTESDSLDGDQRFNCLQAQENNRQVDGQ